MKIHAFLVPEAPKCMIIQTILRQRRGHNLPPVSEGLPDGMRVRTLGGVGPDLRTPVSPKY